jgi:hypothetical protein
VAVVAILAVLAGPNASDEDKAGALDKLSAYFNSLLDSPAEEATEATSEAVEETKEEKTSAAEEDKGPSKEMASALAQIAALQERVAKFEKASAIGSVPRAKAPTVLPRTDPAATQDHVTSMIEAAGRNTLRNLSK